MWSPAKSKEAALFLNFVSRENKEVNIRKSLKCRAKNRNSM